MTYLVALAIAFVEAQWPTMAQCARECAAADEELPVVNMDACTYQCRVEPHTICFPLPNGAEPMRGVCVNPTFWVDVRQASSSERRFTGRYGAPHARLVGAQWTPWR